MGKVHNKKRFYVKESMLLSEDLAKSIANKNYKKAEKTGEKLLTSLIELICLKKDEKINFELQEKITHVLNYADDTEFSFWYMEQLRELLILQW